MGHRMGDRQIGPELTADEVPEEEGEGSDRQDAVGEVSRDRVGELLNRRFAGLGIFHQFDDAGQGRVLADPTDAHDQRPGLVHGAAGDAVARLFGHGDGFARQHRFIDRRGALQNRAVYGDLFAGEDLHPVGDLD